MAMPVNKLDTIFVCVYTYSWIDNDHLLLKTKKIYEYINKPRKQIYIDFGNMNAHRIFNFKVSIIFSEVTSWLKREAKENNRQKSKICFTGVIR